MTSRPLTARPSRAALGTIPRTLAALSVLAGVALWITPATFDLAILPSDRIARVAMLPPLWQIPIFVLAASLGIAALARLLPSQVPGTTGEAGTASDVLLPAAGLALLLLPYLPWIPDLLPILRVLAGPGRPLIWFAVFALIARGFWRAVPRPLQFEDAPPARVVLALMVVGTLICGSVAMVFTRGVLFPGGDEPHYLIIAQSLWRDGDLKIENNHQRGDYDEYFEGDLRPHYLTRGVDREIYSIHPIGVSVLLAPIYAAGGYRLVVWTLALFASAAAALAWLAAWRVSGSRAAATAAWMACCLNGPWVFNSFTVYPEVPAALMVAAAWLLLTTSAAAGPGVIASLVSGAAIGTLPWLSTKYAPMAFVLVLVALARIWWPARPDARQPSVATDVDAGATAPVPPAASAGVRDGGRPMLASLALLVPVVVSLAGWILFFHAIWGTYSPAAPYGSQRETRLEYLPAGGPGLLFDQEYGLLAFAPALFLGLTGLVAMIAARGRARRMAIEILLIGGALLGTVGAFHLWWGGSATVGRPIISGLLLLAVPFAWRYQQQRDKPALRAAYHVLIVAGLALGLTLALAQEGLLLAASRNGTSRLLEWLSPTWSLWTIAPSFIAQSAPIASTITLLWVGAALLAGWWLSRRPATLAPGPATLTALGACTVVLLTLSLLAPLAAAPATPLLSRLQTRGRSALLDSFDAARQPLAILYNPLRPIDPASPPSLIEFVAGPTDRRPRPPIPLMYNGRWSLPAGRYTVELITRREASAAAGEVTPGDIVGSLSLMLGYSGRPAREWEVSMGQPGVWGRSFELLTDMNLVGFRASPEIERAAPTLRIRPETIIDARARLPPAEVSSAAMLGDTTIYFHDARMRVEGDGFWTPGSSTVTLTVSAPRVQPAQLALRAGPVPTAVGLSTQGWRERVTLEPHGEKLVTLPPPRAGVLRLTIETSTAFVPAKIDPASQDSRALGAWIAIPGSDTAAASASPSSPR